MHLRTTFSYLQEDIEVPQYVGKLHGGPYLWIAPKGHYGKKLKIFKQLNLLTQLITHMKFSNKRRYDAVCKINFFNEQFCLDFF